MSAVILATDAVPNESRRPGESQLLYPAIIRFADGSESKLLFTDNQIGAAMERAVAAAGES